MARGPRSPVLTAWLALLVFLLLCGAALMWAGIARGKPLPRLHPQQACARAPFA